MTKFSLFDILEFIIGSTIPLIKDVAVAAETIVSDRFHCPIKFSLIK